MTNEEAFDILLDTVANKKTHPYYQHVTDLADDYRMYVTGNDVDKVLVQFNPREDNELFDQRKRLTIPITPAVISSIKKPFNKVPRTPPVTRKIVPKSDAGKDAVMEIEDRIKSFYGAENNVGGLDYYLQNRFVDLSFIDPNAWVIVGFDAFDSKIEKANPRPYEITSKEAINFRIVNNIVQWLIIQVDIKYEEKDGDNTIIKDGIKFILYADNVAVEFTQTAEQDDARILEIPGEQIKVIENIGTFIVNYYPTLTQKVPAFRIGYIKDIETSGETYVAPFHDALCYLKKTIKQGSEYDLSTCLHVFPQKIVRLIKGCPGEDGQKCLAGYLTDGSLCGVCKGSGVPIHTSGQDVVEVELPDTKDDLIPLTDYIYYVPLPIELLNLQKQWIDELQIQVHQTIFNSTALIKTSSGATGTSDAPMAITATEQNDNMDSVYDTLSPFAEKVSSVWQTVVELIAIITDNKEKVTIIHRFPSKFKLKSRQDLYNERSVLENSGAPYFAIASVDDELAEDIYADDPDGLIRYRVKRDHFPFIGKTDDQIQMLLGSTTVLKKTKVLYNYYDEIFIQIEKEKGTDFYLGKYAETQALIDAKVTDIIKLLDGENNTAFNFKLNAISGAGNAADNNAA